MIALLPWLKSPNLWAIVAILALCAGIFNAGARHNERKHEIATAQTNTLIVEQRGKDEIEMKMEEEGRKMRDALFASAPRQKLILDEATAKLLGGR